MGVVVVRTVVPFVATVNPYFCLAIVARLWPISWPPMARDAFLKLRLDSRLKVALKQRAAAHDQSVSDYVRQLILKSAEVHTILDEMVTADAIALTAKEAANVGNSAPQGQAPASDKKHAPESARRAGPAPAVPPVAEAG